MAVHPNSLANLKPNRGGCPGPNPEGRNQWTYRRKALEALDKRISKNVDEAVDPVWDALLAGEPWACKLVWDRILPVVQKHEVELPAGTSVTIETEPERLDEVVEILNEANALH